MTVSAKQIAWTMALLTLASVASIGSAQVSVKEDVHLFMPGSQQGSVNLESAGRCDNCHGGYNDAIEPARNWRGSMMANAARDPIWLATLAVAAQDSVWALGNKNATDLCIRCHSPSGWLGGRSEPTNTTALAGSDFEGVTCDFCHRMVDPIHAANQADVAVDTDTTAIALASETRVRDFEFLSTLALFDGSPFFNPADGFPVYWGTGLLPNYVEASAGQFYVDTSAEKRGPRSDAVPKHQWRYSRFHKSKAFCASCHDVSNPALANVLIEEGLPQKQAGATYFHVERTYSEFSLSAYGRGAGAATDPALGVGWAAKCQDCHMRNVTGVNANKRGTPTRSDLALHDLTGGNVWMSAILASVDQGSPTYDPINYAILSGTRYPGARIDVTGLLGYGTALLDASGRALQQLQMAARIEVVSENSSSIVLRIYNNTGHKLLSGYPEGRRMWLNVRFLDAEGNLIDEVNPYEPLVVTRDAQGHVTDALGGDLIVTRDDLVWEAHMSSALTEEAETFHFVLASDRYKDNRIPPKGFDIGAAPDRIVVPRAGGSDAPAYFTSAEYSGGYDEVVIPKPPDSQWSAALYYQTTSREYIEFLRSEINGSGGTLSAPTPSGEPFAYIAQNDAWFASLRDWGNAMWELWAHNGGAPPVLMAQIGVDPPCEVPSSPFGFSATGTKRSATLQWNAVDGAAGYKIYYSQGGKYTLIGSTTGTSYVDRGLQPDQTFCYAVTAFHLCDDGSETESPPTTESCATATKH